MLSNCLNFLMVENVSRLTMLYIEVEKNIILIQILIRKNRKNKLLFIRERAWEKNMFHGRRQVINPE